MMVWILECIVVLIVACFIIAPKIEFIREFKRKREELREKGELSRQANTNIAKIPCFMFSSSIIIAIIFNIIFEHYIRKVNISISLFLWEVFIVFMCECAIGSLWAFGREFILIYKTKGIFVAAFTFIFTIIILFAMMYVKYRNLILRG